MEPIDITKAAEEMRQILESGFFDGGDKVKKSVLVIDTPSNCKECRLNKCESWTDEATRPLECPLRPLPVRMTGNYYDFETYTSGVMHGHNHVLDEIGG